MFKKLPNINQWWSKGKNKYDIFIKDYKHNIKPIIGEIIKRQNNYNSFLISEEKVHEGQIKLGEKIIKDYKSLFCIIFHGRKGKNGLPTGFRLYFPKK